MCHSEGVCYNTSVLGVFLLNEFFNELLDSRGVPVLRPNPCVRG